MKNPSSMTCIGRMSYVSLLNGAYKNIPAKNDTGAFTSAIWASSIELSSDNVLSFCLFGEGSEFYTGKKHETKDYKVRIVRSSNGHEQIRYSVQLPIEMEGQSFAAEFTLTSREKNRFPILIGTRLISGRRFIVDVNQDVDEYRRYSNESDDDFDDRRLELQEIADTNPELFHKEYHSGE